jgi:hypothetical protein
MVVAGPATLGNRSSCDQYLPRTTVDAGPGRLESLILRDLRAYEACRRRR